LPQLWWRWRSFGGAIFEYVGTLSLINDIFSGNAAIGGTGELQNGQGKGGALFVYDGATASSLGSTFIGDTASDAGKPGFGPMYGVGPYLFGAPCPGQDTVDICGTLLLPSFAIFQGVDTVTQGKWSGKYGSGGYLIPNGGSSPTDHTSVSFSQDFTYTWAGLTSDPRALQISPGVSQGIASAYLNYYGQTFFININIHDVVPHRVALYLLDWDGTSRSETVTITDASTGALYDTEIFSGFHNGEYAIWEMKGNLRIRVTPKSGPSAAVSGIFFN
jgi:hypothetical protein